MNRIWIGAVVLMVVAGCTHTDTTMSTGSGKGHFDRIMKYVDEEMGGDNWRYNEAITKLRRANSNLKCNERGKKKSASS